MTSGLRVEGLIRRWDERVVLAGVDLDVAAGEIVAVLGPSGCGKTTLLRIVAGLDVANEGVIRIDGEDVTARPPAGRQVGMVFQHHALLPHLSVAENIGFGLAARRRPAAEVNARVAQAAQLVRCTEHLNRTPTSLSGGERQRVALARALVREPRLVLLDEPLSSLDVHDRARLRTELRTALGASGSTALHVTHDQGEAFAIGDRVAMLAGGVVQQIGTADELYDRPATQVVATFVGSPAMNILTVAHGAAPRAGPFAVELPAECAPLGAQPLVAAIRPNDVRLVGHATDRAVAAVITAVEVADEVAVVHLDVDGHEVRALAGRADRPRPGDSVAVLASPARFHFFDAASGSAVWHPR